MARVVYSRFGGEVAGVSKQLAPRILQKEAGMLSRLKTALRTLLRRTQVEHELDEELRYHLEQQTEQNIRLGMNPEEAPHPR